MFDSGRTLITAPAIEPLSLLDAKEHIREDLDEQDGIINALIQAARSYVEQRSWRALMTQTWDIRYDRFPPRSCALALPLPPLQSVTSIQYVDADGATQPFTDFQFDKTSERGRVAPTVGNEWPEVGGSLGAVVIRIVAGYGDLRDDVPQPLRQAMKLLVGAFYEGREDEVIGQGLTATALQRGADALIDQYQVRTQVG